MIQANVVTRPKTPFSPDASYVVAGGFGGLGRSFLRWMASHGARNLIILSRSGAASPAAKALVSELREQGVRFATPAVDISNLEMLRKTLLGLSKSMPPIRGCIQATVALRVSRFPFSIAVPPENRPVSLRSTRTTSGPR